LALLVLAFFALIILSFLGAKFSSKVRSERKSIASFHEQMGQLSGVVKPESRAEDATSLANNELFAPAPSHVRVLGKASTSKSAGTGKRRSYRVGAANAANGHGSRSPARRGTPSSSSGKARSESILSTESKASLHELNTAKNDVAPQVDPGIEVASPGRRTRLSSSARSAGSVLHTEVLHFDDNALDATGEKVVLGPVLGSRRLSAKILAVASVVTLVGLGMVVVALNATRASDSTSRSPNVTADQHPTGKSKSVTATTEPRSSRPGPLTPTSADSTGSTYFLSSLPITLAVSASAPAWLEESVSPGSKILWQGIVPAGGSKTLTLNSSMWIRTGNVGVLTMVANGQPVSFSAAPGVYEFTFRQGVKA